MSAANRIRVLILGHVYIEMAQLILKWFTVLERESVIQVLYFSIPSLAILKPLQYY